MAHLDFSDCGIRSNQRMGWGAVHQQVAHHEDLRLRGIDHRGAGDADAWRDIPGSEVAGTGVPICEDQMTEPVAARRSFRSSDRAYRRSTSVPPCGQPSSINAANVPDIVGGGRRIDGGANRPTTKGGRAGTATSPPILTSTPDSCCAEMRSAVRSTASAFAEDPRSKRLEGYPLSYWQGLDVDPGNRRLNPRLVPDTVGRPSPRSSLCRSRGLRWYCRPSDRRRRGYVRRPHMRPRVQRRAKGSPHGRPRMNAQHL